MVAELKQVLDEHGVPLVYDQTLIHDDPALADGKPLGAVVKGNQAIITDDVRVTAS
jgi:hypothetical protein